MTSENDYYVIQVNETEDTETGIAVGDVNTGGYNSLKFPSIKAATAYARTNQLYPEDYVIRRITVRVTFHEKYHYTFNTTKLSMAE